MTARVAVVVPVRDDPDRLARCLAALAAQTVGAGVEVVVVDDGSAAPPVVPDGVRLLGQPPTGSYAARNRGLAATSAPVVAFTDADCRPEPDWLARALAALDADPSIDAVAGAIEVPVSRGWDPIARHDALTAFPQRHFVERWGFGATANLVVRRRAFDAVGEFDGTLRSGGDAEWGERATAAGLRVVYRDDVRVRHPARSTLAELVEKTTRTARGVEQIAHRRGNPDPLGRALAGHLLRPWRELPALLGRRLGPSGTVQFFAVSLVQATLVAAATVRFRADHRRDRR